MRRLLVLLWLACAWQAGAQGAVVRVAFGDPVPPFSMPNPPSGIHVEVVRAALAVRGHTLVPMFMPVRRLALAFRIHEVDAVTIDTTADMGKDVYFADPAVVFENVFFSLKQRRLQIDKPVDLTGLRVIGFMMAAQRFPDWLAIPTKAGLYTEQPDQYQQVAGLQSGRYDLALCDRSIFRYYALRYARDTGGPVPELEEHPIRAQQGRDYHTAFHDRALRDDFQAGLQAIKQDGRYKAIYDKYLQP